MSVAGPTGRSSTGLFLKGGVGKENLYASKTGLCCCVFDKCKYGVEALSEEAHNLNFGYFHSAVDVRLSSLFLPTNSDS